MPQFILLILLKDHVITLIHFLQSFCFQSPQSGSSIKYFPPKEVSLQSISLILPNFIDIDFHPFVSIILRNLPLSSWNSNFKQLMESFLNNNSRILPLLINSTSMTLPNSLKSHTRIIGITHPKTHYFNLLTFPGSINLNFVWLGLPIHVDHMKFVALFFLKNWSLQTFLVSILTLHSPFF